MLKGYSGGPWDVVKARIGKYMPDGSEWNNIAGIDQAAQSVRSKLAPKMRAVGSGATSDFEMKMWLEAIPSLMMTDNGRNLVKKYTQRVADRAATKADIEMEIYNKTGNLPSAKAVRDEMGRRFNRFLDDQDMAFMGGSPAPQQQVRPQAQPQVQPDQSFAFVAPNGKRYTFPSAEAMNKAKKAMGI